MMYQRTKMEAFTTPVFGITNTNRLCRDGKLYRNSDGYHEWRYWQKCTGSTSQWLSFTGVIEVEVQSHTTFVRLFHMIGLNISCLKQDGKSEYKLVWKDLIFVKDVDAFLEFVAQQRFNILCDFGSFFFFCYIMCSIWKQVSWIYRGIDPSKMLVRLSLDGGGGSFKVVVNIFDPESMDAKQGELMTGWPS